MTELYTNSAASTLLPVKLEALNVFHPRYSQKTLLRQVRKISSKTCEHLVEK